jgi:hypothetical protein
MDDTCVVISGLLRVDFIQPLIDMYKEVPHKIISTWKDQPHIDELEKHGFIIRLNDYPSYRNCANYQTINIREGCLLAKSLGFSYVIRMRTDLICNDVVKFTGCIKHLYKEKITVLGFIQTSLLYIIDFFIAGPINEILLVFNEEQKEGDKRFVEQYWMEEYFNKKDLTFSDLKERLYTCHPVLQENNIEMELISKNWGKIIEKYCNQNIILN